jgi:alpha-glucoside transport system substrate-binding protein
MVKQSRTMVVFAAVGALLVAACSPAATSAPSGPGATSAPPATSGPATAAPTQGGTEPTAAPQLGLPTVPTGYTELDQALGSDKPFNGKKVSFQTQWIGGEGEGFAAAIKDFVAATGIAVQIDSIGSSHETVLKTRIDGGQPPDMAMLAQPTGVLAYAAQGKLIDVATFMPASKLNEDFPSTIGLISEGGHIWGVPTKADVKSMVWYPIKAFEANGYAVPKTWDELITLADKIVADGKGAPFCASAGGPGTATGWQITDWIEEVLLKTEDPSVTAGWISHEIPFTDPRIKAAFDRVGSLLFKQGYVDGGGPAIVNNAMTEVMDPMFNQDTAAPGCWMQKIPVWYGPDFFPDKRVNGGDSKYIIGEDIGIFPFPTISEEFKGAEGSADAIMVLADRPEVRAFVEFLATPEGLYNWIVGKGVLSPNVKTPPEWYANNYKLKVANEIASSATAIGFDASDLMPPSVGAGSFWTGVVDWANNNGTNTDAVLQAIDASWPQ